MKKVLILVIIITLISSIGSSLSADNIVGKGYITDITKITLNDALSNRAKEENSSKDQAPAQLISYTEKDGELIIPLTDALQNIEYTDQQIILYDKKLALSQKQYYASLSEAVRSKTGASTTDTNAKKKELLDWRIKLNDYENLKHDRADFVESVKTNFEKNYINGIQLQNDRDVIKKEIEKLEIMIKQSKMRLELGLIKESDMDSLNSSKALLTAQLNSTERQLDTTMMSIKKSLGIENGKGIQLINVKEEYKKYDDNMIENRIKSTAQESYDLEKLKKDLDLTRLEYYIVTTYFEDSIPAEADTLETSIEEKEYDLNSAALENEATLWNSYYALKNLEDNIEIQRINVKIADRNLSDVKLKINLNKATSLDEITASINLAKAQNQLQSMINQYMLNQEDLNRNINTTVK